MGVLGFKELGLGAPRRRRRAPSLPPGFRGLGQMIACRIPPVNGLPNTRMSGLGAGGSFAPTYGGGLSSPSMTVSTIPDGPGGTVKTLELMRDAVLGPEGAHNRDVRLLAQQIVSDVGNKDYEGEARAIFDFMRANVRYTLDPRGLEWVQSPWWTLLVIGQGDCDDHATATCALATSLGHGCGFRTVKGDRSRADEWSHVYAVIGIRKNGQELWLPADSTEKHARLGSDPPGAESVEMKTWVVVPA